ncbi:16S rRNA (guanine(527)-N(7))-methyltransferase RsmG [Thermaerobacter subterraneus]|uniref:Ribosomal RNA small subunit methyltransferase G n=1 Tax=Thermaerobacter subterraneus DSM 13965 TaxID=867903 RepID=K6QDJ6_9FIRM|nr:16S rRNA (guanine(527)-N(7))-methyltransferase RsmG [Thermaerobacter subterraneus]EKP94771.1 16S rRNA m(7)G-527 methyltransferase [Thermaerobacter subterraneus DSM 13965]
MDGARWQDELARLGAAFGVRLSGDALVAMWRHWQLVREATGRFNLTAVREDAEALVRHYVDSLVLLGIAGPWAAEGLLVDLGSGAGFPGIPLLVALGPGWRGLLLESQGKKAAFLREAVTVLGLDGRVIVEPVRAEEAGRRDSWREQADLVVARAVAPLNVLAEYGLPLLRVGGRLWAYKGPRVAEEWEAGRRAATVLGGRLVGAREVELPGGAGRRVLVEVVKEEPTPAGYPRRPGLPARRPLGA